VAGWVSNAAVDRIRGPVSGGRATVALAAGGARRAAGGSGSGSGSGSGIVPGHRDDARQGTRAASSPAGFSGRRLDISGQLSLISLREINGLAIGWPATAGCAGSARAR
jgi:hypothetical protein